MILIIHPELVLAQPLLENIAPCARLWEISDIAAFAAGPGAQVRAIACIGGKKTDAALFTLFPKLEAVIAAGVGVDGVDLVAAKAAGIGFGDLVKQILSLAIEKHTGEQARVE